MIVETTVGDEAAGWSSDAREDEPEEVGEGEEEMGGPHGSI
jgi:hypothetical protein